MIKLIKINDKIFINPERIQYLYQNEFMKGTILYFGEMQRITITEEETNVLMKELKKRGMI